MKDDTHLDEAIAQLPEAIPPARDLWPAIESRLEARDGIAAGDGAGGAVPAGRGSIRRWQAAAAAVLLMAGASGVTFLATRAHYAPGAPALAAAGTGPVSAELLPVDYHMARGELLAVLEASLERLDPASRRSVTRNLAEIRAALTAIERALAEAPDNAALQHLFVSTSRRELSLLQSVQRLAGATREDRDS
jgi:hypothetical protein